MSGDLKSALCGKCKVALEGPADPKPDSVFACPSCGEADTLQNVTRIIAEFVEETTARFFEEKLRGIAARSKAIKLTSKPIPHRQHRFVIDLKL